MAIFKCKMCGGSLDISEGVSIATCEYCGTKQTIPKLKDDVVTNLFNRANNLRLKCEFDKAEQVYEKILDIDNTDSEAHWGIVLCKYGIEYVEDPKTYSRIPTCHRTLYEAVLTDVDYLAAIENADAEQKELYIAEAKIIDKLQKNILTIVNNEEPFDVFICYKETDENGKRTVDSVIANDIYYQLTGEGFKVFYAPITLEDKLGYEYEPYIFAALNSAKVMLVVGTKPEYFDSAWVRNEWSRFIKLAKTDRSKLLIPCYKDMDVYELPDEFVHLQAQDMGKIGFITDVIRGLKKVFNRDGQQQSKPLKTKSTAYNKPNKEKMLLEEFKNKFKSEYCLAFPFQKVASTFFIFTIVFYLYFLIEISMAVNNGNDMFMFLLMGIPFIAPALIFSKLIKRKIIAIIMETLSLAWTVVYFSDIYYSISNGVFSIIVLMSLLCVVWMVLVCFTKRIENRPKTKKKVRFAIISIIFSIVLTIALEIFGITFIDYQLAKIFYNFGAYEYADEYFMRLDDYKDSTDLSYRAKLLKIKNAECFQRVELKDTYYGDTDWWYVIANESNKVLLLSYRSANCSNIQNIIGGWKDSSIRAYLNNEYYENINSVIKENIITTKLTNSSNTNDSTEDKVFLLGANEITRYMPSVSDRLKVFSSNGMICVRAEENGKYPYISDGVFGTITYFNGILPQEDANGDGRVSFSEWSDYQSSKNNNGITKIEKFEYYPAMWIDISGIE